MVWAIGQGAQTPAASWVWNVRAYENRVTFCRIDSSIVVHVGTRDDWPGSLWRITRGQLTVTAGEQGAAGGCHLGREGELLAVKDQGVPMLVESLLVGMAVLLQVLQRVLDRQSRLSVAVESLLVRHDSLAVRFQICADLRKSMLDESHVALEFCDVVLQSLQRDHQVSFGFDARFVSLLVEHVHVGIKLRHPLKEE